MDVRRVVGRNVRRYRERARLSQEELAHRAGLDRTYVSGIERGIRNPTVLVLQDLAVVLKVKPADLLVEAAGTAVKSATGLRAISSTRPRM
jgi:transcriptional regulator with XRE-family HTH domain